jgi:hypothetical protein
VGSATLLLNIVFVLIRADRSGRVYRTFARWRNRAFGCCDWKPKWSWDIVRLASRVSMEKESFWVFWRGTKPASTARARKARDEAFRGMCGRSWRIYVGLARPLVIIAHSLAWVKTTRRRAHSPRGPLSPDADDEGIDESCWTLL